MTAPSTKTRTREISFKVNVWKIFAALALLYIIPFPNPVHSWPWWAVTIPLWFVPFFKTLAWAVKRHVMKKKPHNV